jgi:hypothetical protein
VAALSVAGVALAAVALTVPDDSAARLPAAAAAGLAGLGAAWRWLRGGR